MNKDLRYRSSSRKEKWTVDQLRAGFEYFKTLNGKYPGAKEVDLFDYLPTSRSIQRTHNGLVSLRAQL